MGPPQDRDVAMAPPPPPHIPSTQPPPPQANKDNQDVPEKYRKLKRRYFELEEKHQDTLAELRLSGERNVRLREEREYVSTFPIARVAQFASSLILQRIHELETRSEPNTPSLPFPPSSAFPRSLLSSRTRAAFVSNLRHAMVEDEADDYAVDPLLSSRYIGPLARKRTDGDHREQIDDDPRQPRRQTKRSRATAKGKEPLVPPLLSQPILTLAPVPQPPESGTPPLLVSHKGARLRLKPPVKPPTDSDAGSSVNHRPPSPLSPAVTPPEDHPYQSGSYPPNGAQPSVSIPPPANSPPLPGQSPLLTASPASRPSDIQRHAKPKRLKAHTVTSKSFSIPTVPRDKKGRPLLPLNVGIMTVINLGEVCMREHFHTERYIFPVGYEVTRRYHSTVDPTSDAVYHCSILDGGDGPKFQIVASDVPDRPMIAGTATGAWSSIVKQANAIRNRQHSNSVSGPDFFGLGQNSIKHLIQELPNADRLRDYVWQHFVEGG
ncbi:F/Y-rich N-terminus-domain-containing protein [Boletus edulis BED1]|uniref:F/Y-rich N-terminus-domain-containing protein n=1 Tax=Boletus edulis BED1 TaxID=1328754 RepID=A0AAD4BY60_BOLED|nr:F/Y-rich N-terminus-domain-containing protein [Boletus edulis BED1]